MTTPPRPWLVREDWREGVIHWKPNRNRFAGLSLREIVASLFGGGSATMPPFGDSTFTFQRVPFVLGGKLEGTLRVPFTVLGEDSMAMLGCFPGARDDAHSLHWRAIHPILPQQLRRDGEMAVFDVEFNIPENRKPARGGLLPFTWELSVIKGFAGRKIALFQVPVFSRAASPFVRETIAARQAKRDARKALSVLDE